MGAYFILFFPEEDTVHVEEIAKLHNVPVEIVDKHYKEMLKAISDEVQG